MFIPYTWPFQYIMHTKFIPMLIVINHSNFAFIVCDTMTSGAISKQPILAKALLDIVKLLVELLVDVVVVPDFTFIQ